MSEKFDIDQFIDITTHEIRDFYSEAKKSLAKYIYLIATKLMLENSKKDEYNRRNFNIRSDDKISERKELYDLVYRFHSIFSGDWIMEKINTDKFFSVGENLIGNRGEPTTSLIEGSCYGLLIEKNGDSSIHT